MKPGLFSILIVFAVLFTLTACGPENQPGQEPAAVSTIPPLPTVTTTPEDAAPRGSAPEPGAETDPYTAYGFDQSVTASGQVLILTGRVLDVNGGPVEGAAVEIWQTDANGVYDHPGDSSTGSRDMGFQFYGTSVVDAQGNYAFRTLRPGEYEPRPPHIHVKVRVNGAVVLTTQLYFSDTGNGGGLGAGADKLLLTLEEAPNGGDFLVGNFDFVVDTGMGSGALPLTPSQAEGPYYPVVNVSEYDRDLAFVGE